MQIVGVDGHAKLCFIASFCPPYLPARIDLAQLLLLTDNAVAALNVLDETPEAQKDDTSRLLMRIWALLALDDRTAARKEMDRLLATQETTEFRLQDGILRISENDVSGGRLSLLLALKQDQRELRALGVLAETYIAEDQIAAAVGSLRTHSGRTKDSALVELLVGNLHFRSGEREKARKAFKTAKAADPSLVEADLALAELAVSEGNFQAAKKHSLARISILALARSQYTPALPRIPRLSALNPAHHLRRQAPKARPSAHRC